MAVITVSRQAGSGGDEIAKRVCDLLGYHYFDKQLMTQVAADVGLSRQEMVDFSEEHYKVKSFLDLLLSSSYVAQVRTWTQDAAGKETLSLQELNEAQCIDLIRSTVRAAYLRSNIVIVGRGGQAILKKGPNVLHVRLEAPLKTRVHRIQAREGMGYQAAKSWVAERDEAAAQYLSRFFKIRWDDPLLYHLLINTGQWELEAAAQVIVHAASQLPAKPIP
jgi:cytidylate kinase